MLYSSSSCTPDQVLTMTFQQLDEHYREQVRILRQRRGEKSGEKEVGNHEVRLRRRDFLSFILSRSLSSCSLWLLLFDLSTLSLFISLSAIRAQLHLSIGGSLCGRQ